MAKLAVLDDSRFYLGVRPCQMYFFVLSSCAVVCLLFNGLFVLCFIYCTSSVNLTGSYTEDEPDLKFRLNSEK